jgi:hypothetical protein
MSLWLGILASSGLAGGDFESIATVTVGSGGASTIEFTSIPSTYQHLQIRMVGRESGSVTGNAARLRLNSDTGSNYATHRIDGNGSAAGAVGYASLDRIDVQRVTGASAAASTFGVMVVDILDYASISKNKTVRALGGCDLNGSGFVNLTSGLWMSTSAITTLTLLPIGTASWAQHTTAALYGVKAP